MDHELAHSLPPWVACFVKEPSGSRYRMAQEIRTSMAMMPHRDWLIRQYARLMLHFPQQSALGEDELMVIAQDFADDMAEFPVPAIELTMTWARKNLRFRPAISELIQKAKELTDHGHLAARWLEREQERELERMRYTPPQIEYEPVGPERVSELMKSAFSKAPSDK
jgi:hypothetical protein